MLTKTFERLTLWRKLPGYSLERRIDIFFSFFLGEILHKAGLSTTPGAPLHIVPEFPLRTNERNLQRCQADFLCFLPDKVVMVELKTDPGSVGIAQVEFYGRQKDKRWGALAKDLIEFASPRSTSKHKQKYQWCIEELRRLGLIHVVAEGEVFETKTVYQLPVAVCYIAPTDVGVEGDVVHLMDRFPLVDFTQLREILNAIPATDERHSLARLLAALSESIT